MMNERCGTNLTTKTMTDTGENKGRKIELSARTLAFISFIVQKLVILEKFTVTG